jgi:hypothetical protein
VEYGLLLKADVLIDYCEDQAMAKQPAFYLYSFFSSLRRTDGMEAANV